MPPATPRGRDRTFVQRLGDSWRGGDPRKAEFVQRRGKRACCFPRRSTLYSATTGSDGLRHDMTLPAAQDDATGAGGGQGSTCALADHLCLMLTGNHALALLIDFPHCP